MKDISANKNNSKESVARLYKRINSQMLLALRVRHNISNSKNSIELGTEYRPGSNAKFNFKISDDLLLDVAASLDLTSQVKLNIASKVMKPRTINLNPKCDFNFG